MIVKQTPEDFQVEELSNLLLNSAGNFATYRLRKTGWTTPDAIAAIQRRWKIPNPRLSWGGLKDRHATTVQFITIERGPRRNLNHQRLSLEYIGQRLEPFTSADISANRFTIVLRSLPIFEVERASAAIGDVQSVGLPNYFDDQRFGSVSGEGEFIGKELVLGNFERALWLALAAPYEFDRAEEKRDKTILRDHWGAWPECVRRLRRGHVRDLMASLAADPTDFRGAIAHLRPELQGLYLAAYQSHLWNRMLARWLTQSIEPQNLVEVDLKLGRVLAPSRMSPETQTEWERLVLPLPSARIHSDPTALWNRLADDILKEEGLTLADLKVKGMRKPFFTKGDRVGCVHPANITQLSDDDDRHPGMHKLTLKFDLPRGSYATMLVKRITCRPPGP